MNHFSAIVAVSAFKKSTREYLSKIEFSGAPLLLTLNGGGAFVLQDMNSFMRSNELAEMGRHSLAMNGMLDRLQEKAE